MHTFQAINWYALSKSPKSMHRSNNKLVLVCINNWVFPPLGSTIIFSTLFIVCLASSICLQIFVPAFVGPWLCVDVAVLWGRICSGFSGLANLTTKFTLLFSSPSVVNRIIRSTAIILRALLFLLCETFYMLHVSSLLLSQI